MNCSRVFNSIGICGGGKMGTSFFNFIIPFGYNLVFYIRNEQRLLQIQKSCQRKLGSGENAENAPNSILFTNKIDALRKCDVIFEFISEDVEIKSALLEFLVNQAENPLQIIATGSSTLVPSKLCRKEALFHCIGVHFIYPVQYVKTVEVIHNSKTSQETIEKIRDFLVYTGKNPLIVSEKTGSFSIRTLLAIQNEAFKLSREFDISPSEIDRVIASDNLVLPPFELCDSVGFDIVYNSIKGLLDGCDDLERYSGFRDHLYEMIQSGCLGRKNGRGFFSESENYRNKSPQVDKQQEDIIRTRIKLVYINSCLQLLDEGSLDTVQLDSAMCEISQSQKGPVSKFFELGAENILAELKEFYNMYGAQYKPPKILKYMASFQIGRDEIDRQIRLFKMGGGRPHWHYEDILASGESIAQA